MEKQKQLSNILVIGDSKPQSDSDLSFNKFDELGHDFHFLYLGKKSLQKKSEKISITKFISQVERIIREKQISIIYLRADWFDTTFLYFSKVIVSYDFGVPVVVGYHCHTAKANQLEQYVLEHADAHIFINEVSKEYFHRIYSLNKPYILVPSLFLPNLEWYRIPLKDKLSSNSDELHCVIPTSAIRIATPPEKEHEKIHIENYLFDRYDYYQVIKKLIREKIHVHIYGNFKAPLKGYSRITEEIYKNLKKNEFGDYFHIEGFYRKSDFNSELSKYDFAVFTGFIPNQEVPPFEHMNYQVRFNPTLAANLPVFVAKNTGLEMEKELTKNQQGYIFSSFYDLKKVASDRQSLGKMAEKCRSSQKLHSNDFWMPKIRDFFSEVINQPKLVRNNDTRFGFALQREAFYAYTRGRIKRVIEKFL